MLYNTCSIRDKAEQKVFNRLQQFKREAGKGKMFGVLGCVAQQEGEKIFERAPHVSLVAARPATPSCREMLVQLEAGNRRVTGLSLDTEETFDTPFTRRDNPHRAYITIIEGCDKSCAYCVVPFTRGPERSRTSASVMAEARAAGRAGLHRDPVAGPEREQLSRSVARGLGFRHAAGARGRDARHPPRALHHFASARFRARPSSTPSTRTRRSAITCICRCSPARRSVLAAMDRLYTRDEYMRRIEWLKSARRNYRHHHRHHRGLPRRDRGGFRADAARCSTRCEYDSLFSFKYSPRPNTPRWRMDDQIPEEEKQRRLAIVQEKQRAIQIRRNAELIGTVRGGAGGGLQPGHWASGSAAPRDNRTLNFTASGRATATSLMGQYLPVRVTRAGPNSLVGESVTVV